MEHTRDAYSVRDNFFIQFCVLLTDLDAGAFERAYLNELTLRVMN